MTERLDIVAPRAGKDGRTYFTRIGVAFATKNGGWSLSFEALPLPTMNDQGQIETRALLMPPREKTDAPPQRSSAVRPGGSDGLGDFPF